MLACMAKTHTFQTTLIAADDSTATAIPVTFDPRDVFGKARVPVVVRINNHSYRSTICNMGAGTFLPLAKINREAAGVAAGQRVAVTLTLDDQPRTVTPQRDLAAALKAQGLLDAFKAMSFTHQKEHVAAVDDAKKPETRTRRIAACVEMVRTRSVALANKSTKKVTKKAVKRATKKAVKKATPMPSPTHAKAAKAATRRP